MPYLDPEAKRAHTRSYAPRQKACDARRYLADSEKNRLANRVWFAKHPEAKKAYNDKHYKRGRAVILAAKDKPCLDCKIQFPPCAMEFDHLDPTTKKFTIGISATKSDKLLLAEIAKCDVVCSNCHAIREQARRDAKKLPVE